MTSLTDCLSGGNKVWGRDYCLSACQKKASRARAMAADEIAASLNALLSLLADVSSWSQMRFELFSESKISGGLQKNWSNRTWLLIRASNFCLFFRSIMIDTNHRYHRRHHKHLLLRLHRYPFGLSCQHVDTLCNKENNNTWEARHGYVSYRV